MSQHDVGKAVMLRSRIQEFFRRFPSLERYVKESRVAEVRVQQIDLDLLQRRPENSYVFSSGDSERHFILMAQDHSEILRVPTPFFQRVRRRFWFDDHKVIPGKRIDEVLDTVDTSAIAYVLEIYDDTPEKHYGTRWQPHVYITIHRVPNGVTLPEWLEHQRRRIQQEVDEEIQRGESTNVVVMISGRDNKCAHIEGGGIKYVGFGASEHSAVGQLILENPEQFGITVVRKKD